MTTRESLETELSRCINTRALYYDALDALAKGGTSYTLKDGDSLRQLTRVDIVKVQNLIKELTARINEITYMLSNETLSRPRRTMFFRGA